MWKKLQTIWHLTTIWPALGQIFVNRKPFPIQSSSNFTAGINRIICLGVTDIFKGVFFRPSNTRSPRNGQDKGTSGHQIPSRVNIYICWKLDCVKVSYKYHVWFSSAAVRTMIIFCHRHLYHNHCSPDRRKREKLISSIKMVFRCFQIWNKEHKWQDCRIQYFDQMQPPRS